MRKVNRQITLAARPSGFPKVSDFQLIYAPLPSPAAGEVLVRSVYLSLDPYMRATMDEPTRSLAPVALGEVMSGAVVGVVTQSAAPELRVGDVVEGPLGWQEYAVAPVGSLRKLDPRRPPISAALGVLGLSGLTAYFGLLDLGQPRPGETVVVSGAAGAVGTLVGQIAKHHGCYVVGVANSAANVAWLCADLGFNAAFDDTDTPDFDATLAALCPRGIDVYFDNVGGALTDAVIGRLNRGARVVVCGQVSQDNLVLPELGPRWLCQLVAREVKVQGFLVASFATRFPAARQQLTRWLDEGKLVYREDVAQGIEAAPQAFIGMLQGHTQGQQLVHLSEL